MYIHKFVATQSNKLNQNKYYTQQETYKYMRGKKLPFVRTYVQSKQWFRLKTCWMSVSL